MRDKTASTARHAVVRDALGAAEEVLAAVDVQLPGTLGAAIAGGAAASTSGTVAGGGSRSELERSADQAKEDFGIERGIKFLLVLTSDRVLLARRSAFGRLKDVVLDVAIGDLEGVRISKQASAVWLDHADGRTLRLETPKAFKFLPPVYEQLPERFASAAGRGGHPRSS